MSGVKLNNRPIEHFYELEREYTYPDRDFRLGTSLRTFKLRNTQDAPVEELLTAVFAHLIELAKAGGQVRKFCAIICHPDLDHPISIPYRRFEQNTPQAILVEFQKPRECQGCEPHRRSHHH
jgi:hypothetical protein